MTPRGERSRDPMTRNGTDVSRRRFLKYSGTGAAFLSASGWRSLTRGDSPADRIRIGVIGMGFRGKYLIGNLPASARVVAICDCAQSRMAETLEPKDPFKSVLASFRENAAAACATYQDYRRMIDREKLDAVMIATPDHHHVLAATIALDAGLDVYLEKPLTVTIREGRLLADKVKQTGRVLQVGSQQRTMELNQFACEFVRDGGLGKVSKVEVPNYPGPMSIGEVTSEPVPEGLDWNLFLGPTPLRPHSRKLWVKDIFKVGNLLWRGWDLYRDFSGHMMTNWGAHSLDMMQYALGRDHTGPVSVEAIDPRSVIDIQKHWDNKTPAPAARNERRFWPVNMRYADGVEVNFRGATGPIRIHGERGVMSITRNKFETDPPDLITDGPDPKLAEAWRGGGNVAKPHVENWLDAIRSGGALNAPVEVGHRTVTVCHLANLARELNRPLQWDPEAERFVDDAEANELLERPRRKEFAL